METKQPVCPDCEDGGFDRRDFLRAVGVSAAAAGVGLPLFATARVAEAAPTRTSPAETAVKALYDALTEEQKKLVCFEWDYQDKGRGLLRTYVSNNWHITPPTIKGAYTLNGKKMGDFYTKKQQAIIHDIFKGVTNPEWYAKFLKQLKDDTGGKEWGEEQNIAIFGTPNDKDNFEFVMTGRHMTLRADGHCNDKVAFGGPIFYGHAASGFTEKVGHPGNVFWPQAQLANKVYKMLDKKQQEQALAPRLPKEDAVGFKGDTGKFSGLAVSELTEEQKKDMQKVLAALIEPFRKEDQDEALECLKKRGGLDKCHLTFYAQGALAEGEYDCWRLEGPAFVWYFRGTPHVHVWVNIANDPAVPLNAKG